MCTPSHSSHSSHSSHLHALHSDRTLHTLHSFGKGCFLFVLFFVVDVGLLVLVFIVVLFVLFVRVFKCSLIKGITPKIRMLYFVLKTFCVFGFCFRTLAVIFVSGMLCFVPINSFLWNFSSVWILIPHFRGIFSGT